MKIILDETEETVGLINDYGDGLNGTLFLVGHEFNWTHLVNAQTIDDAEEAWLDEQDTIPDEEVWEAYGFDSFAEFKEWNEEEGSEHRDLCEGYLRQANCTDSGIVKVGHHHRVMSVMLGKIELRRGHE